MDGMLSQEEINALLGNMNTGSSSTQTSNDAILSDEEKDAIGEISNICMGTAATTLYSLVNQKVVITTPVVEITNWDKLTAEYAKPCVFINILYKDGIDGNNVLILKEDDVKVITDLMMGGDGLNPAPELTELHFSAICEAMNQMMGSSATSLSSMLNCKIDISPPEAELVDMAGNIDVAKASDFLDKDFVRVTFRMTIGDLVDSTIMQLYPIQFARDLYKKFSGESEEKEETPPPAPQPEPQPQPVPQPQPQPQPATGMPMGQPMMGQMPRPQAPQMQNGNLMGQLGGARPIPHFVRKSTGEIINITKPEFIIGKSKTKADYAIENNSAISREHCIVIQRDGVNYIKDNNSTNHTYVNGVELQPGKEVLLKHKTEVRLGDEEFTFLLRKGE